MKGLLKAWDKTAFYLSAGSFYFLFALSLLFAVSFFLPQLFIPLQVLLLALFVAIGVDSFFLFRTGQPLSGERIMEPRLSNGEENKVLLKLTSTYNFKVRGNLIEELPEQFGSQSWNREIELLPNEELNIHYTLKPNERGVYDFGDTIVFCEGPLSLVKRRIEISTGEEVKVFPSIIQLRRFGLLGVGNRNEMAGTRKMRSLGHTMEFEQVRDYVIGDDYRTVNWKATARRGELQANSYTDERSQTVYCIIDKGRIMKMPFNGLTLLDYSINSALALTGVALQKQDKAGLICFHKTLDTFIPADRKPQQLQLIMDSLYRQETSFQEPDYENLFSLVRSRITQRSLLILFTNYESFESMERQLPYLRKLAHYHLLLVVIFENTELEQLTSKEARSLEEIYVKVIAEKYRQEKRRMVKELRANNILSILTPPSDLSISTVNKYLELKNRRAL